MLSRITLSLSILILLSLLSSALLAEDLSLSSRKKQPEEYHLTLRAGDGVDFFVVEGREKRHIQRYYANKELLSNDVQHLTISRSSLLKRAAGSEKDSRGFVRADSAAQKNIQRPQIVAQYFNGWIGILPKTRSLTEDYSRRAKGLKPDPKALKEANDDLKKAASRSAARLHRALQQIEPSSKIRKVFHKAIVAVSFSAKERTVTEIMRQGHFKSIHPNYRVEKFLDQSVASIGAPTVWSSGFRGQGIKIGIIDTGLDYTHSAFGSCTEAQFSSGQCSKVPFGYDVVDNDLDPIDCDGHGTHVGAIASGQSDPLTGVAPDSTIIPIRVLDCFGFGTEEDVIAGIEYAMDPNDDGDFSDRLDVINLSLGRIVGSADDPDALALDAASAVGIVSVAAAGNSGVFFLGVHGTPASSKKAISVAALDREDEIALFSSLGPVFTQDPDNSDIFSLSMKPDIAAPGVEICAARASFLNPIYLEGDRECGGSEDFISLSGTSMASPHIAGVAALIREAHPDWSPDDVKTSLLSTADPVFAPRIAAGTGKVNAVNAVNNTDLNRITLEPLVHNSDERYVTLEGNFTSPTTVTEIRLDYGVYDFSTIPPTPVEVWTNLLSTTEISPEGDFSLQIDHFLFASTIYELRVQISTSEGKTYTANASTLVRNWWITNFSPSGIIQPEDPLVLEVTYKEGFPFLDNAVFDYKVDGSTEWITDGIILDTSEPQKVTATIPGGTFSGVVNVKFRVIFPNAPVEEWIYYLFPIDGSIREGFPVSMPIEERTIDVGSKPIVVIIDSGMNQPVVGDVIGDFKKEIIVARTGVQQRVHIFSDTGEQLREYALGPVFGNDDNPPGLYYAAALGNFDGDRELEIVVLTMDLENDLYVHVINGEDGSPVSGFPALVVEHVSFFTNNDNASLFVEDLFGDSKPEIVVSSNSGSRVTVLRSDGTIQAFREVTSTVCQEGQSTRYYAWNAPVIPVVADFQRDGDPELVFFNTNFTCNGTVTPESELDKIVHILDPLTLESIESWNVIEDAVSLSPFANIWATRNDPSVMDLNGDGQSEIVLSDNSIGLRIFSEAGDLLNGDSTTLLDQQNFITEPFFVGPVSSDNRTLGVGVFHSTLGSTIYGDTATFFTGISPVPDWAFDISSYGFFGARPSVARLRGESEPSLFMNSAFLLGALGAYTGELLPNFPRGRGGRYEILGMPTIVDLNGDNLLEIVTGAKDVDGQTSYDQIYVWNTDLRVHPFERGQGRYSWPRYRLNEGLSSYRKTLPGFKKDFPAVPHTVEP